WELTALFETTNYQTKYATSDNGTSTVLYEVGNHLKITPDAIASRTNTTGGGGGQQTSVPTLTTNTATDLAATTATLNGSITSEGGASSTIVGFQYGLTTSYGSEATSTYSGGTGAFSKGITGLTASTLYHFKAEAYNSAGWGYGADATLTTSAPTPQTGYIDPASNVQYQLRTEAGAASSLNWAHIDQGIRQPNAPSIDSYVTDNVGGKTDIYTMTSLTGVSSISNITVWGYGKGDHVGDGFTVGIYMGGSWLTQTDFNFPTGNGSVPPAWRSVSYDGAWTQADLNAIQVKLIGVLPSTANQCEAIYAVVTYTQ
ncbi:MAG: hypothetical protein WC297_02915, partial [Candidatus Paceibacterota bacterium]